MEITAIVTGAWNAFATKITTFLPKIIGALLILVAGWLLARLLRYATTKFLKLVKLDVAAEATGVKDFLGKGNVQKTVSEIIGALIYWFVMIIVVVASLDALGLPIVSDMLNAVVLYIPNVVAAVVVLTLGVLLGSFLSKVVETAASNAEIKFANILGKASLYVVVFFAGSIAVIQLGIGEEVIAAAFIILLGATALALSLAFGLGGREVAGDYLKKWLEDKRTAKKA
ncbi:MAG: hypothetical protein PVG60_10980 [Desulfarculaceae bacterium]|jgi:hypothetical protein